MFTLEFNNTFIFRAEPNKHIQDINVILVLFVAILKYVLTKQIYLCRVMTDAWVTKLVFSSV